MFFELRKAFAGFVCPEIINRLAQANLLRNEARRAAETDAMTGLANFAALTKASQRLATDWVVIFFDVNQFKLVNDKLGHDMGDKLIVYTAEVVGDVANRYGIKARAFRKGGDELVILAPISIAEEIRDEVESTFGTLGFGDFSVSISGSIGATIAIADQANKSRKRDRKAMVEEMKDGLAILR